MSGGRCAGCGMTNSSCKLVDKHIMGCNAYAALYKSNPSACLPAAEELRRYQASGEADDVRIGAKEARMADRVVQADTARLAQDERWRPRDLLSD